MDVVNEKSYLDERVEPAQAPSKMLGVRVSAWLELAVFLVAALIIDHMALDRHRFADVNPHPFWFIILLLAVQYGAVTGVVAAVVCSLVFLIGNPAISSDALLTSNLAKNQLINPMLWLAMGWLVGEVRGRHIRESERLRSRLVDAEAREAVTAQAYQEVKGRKQVLEERIAGDLRSAITVYQSAKSMESMSPAQLMRAIENVVRELTGAKVFSVFLLDKQGLILSIASGWTDLQSNLSRRIPPSSVLFEMIVGRRELLTVANETHAAALAGEGVMAAPIVARTGEILGMIKLEVLPFSHMGIQAVETLRAVAEWAAQALLNARHFEQALGDAVSDPRHNLMTRSYFERHVHYVKSLGQRAKFPVTLLTLNVATPATAPEEVQVRVARTVRDAVRESLRAVDLAFDYQQDGGQYALILPTTTQDGAEIVREKLTQSLERKLQAQGLRYSFTSGVQVLAA